MGKEYFGIEVPHWLKIRDPELFGPVRLEQIVKGALMWDSRYSVNRDINLSPMLRGNLGTTIKDKTGVELTISGVAGPGWMRILVEDERAEKTVKHELVHAVKPDEYRMLEEPIFLNNGVVVAFSGLCLIYAEGTTKDAPFTLFEEGIAEYTTSHLPGPNMEAGDYGRVCEITAKRIRMAPEICVEWVKNNRVDSFVRSALGLADYNRISSQRLSSLMVEFSEVWDL